MIATQPVAVETSEKRQMRGLVPNLETPHPLVAFLPALFQEDPFAQRFVSAFDEALAPIFLTLDNLTAYMDPWLAPEDFLDWLSSWLALSLDETVAIDRRRAFVAKAFDLYRIRGTVKGLQAQVEIFTGGSVEIVDTGGVASSSTAGASFPGSPNYAVLVRVHVDHPKAINVQRLDALVARAKPAHLTHKIEIVKPSDVKDPLEVSAG